MLYFAALAKITGIFFQKSQRKRRRKSGLVMKNNNKRGNQKVRLFTSTSDFTNWLQGKLKEREIEEDRDGKFLRGIGKFLDRTGREIGRKQEIASRCHS